jgi:hypothetical protein
MLGFIKTRKISFLTSFLVAIVICLSFSTVVYGQASITSIISNEGPTNAVFTKVIDTNGTVFYRSEGILYKRERNSSRGGANARVTDIYTPIQTSEGNRIIQASTGVNSDGVESSFWYVETGIEADGGKIYNRLDLDSTGNLVVQEQRGQIIEYQTFDFNGTTRIGRYKGENDSTWTTNPGAESEYTTATGLIVGGISEKVRNLYKRFALTISCGGDFTCYAANFAYHFFMTPSALLLNLSGSFFDYMVSFSILDMKANFFTDTEINGVETNAVNIGWGIFRDLANILFIFTLLYVSIKTILQGTGSSGRSIVMIVMAAILINFSLFFTKVVIDFSNVLALNFYHQISETVSEENAATLYGDANDLGRFSVAGAFIAKSQLVTLYNKGNSAAGAVEQKADLVYITQQAFFGGLMMLILSVVLFIASLSLVTRLIILVFVLMTSSLAIGSIILPQFKGRIYDKWFSALIGQAFMAPAFLFCLYLSMIFLINMPGSRSGNGLEDILFSNANMILFYIITIGFIIASLILSKKLSDQAGSYSGKITGGIGKASIGGAALAGRFVGGGTARRLAGKIEGNNVFSRAAKNNLNRVASSSFDVRNSRLMKTANTAGIDLGKAGGKGGYDAIVKKADKKRESNYKMVGENTRKENKAKDNYYRAMEQYKGDEIFDEMIRNERYKSKLEADKKKETDPAKIAELESKIKIVNGEFEAARDLFYEKIEKEGTGNKEQLEKIFAEFAKAKKAPEERQANYIEKGTPKTKLNGKISNFKGNPFTMPSHVRFVEKHRASEAAKMSKSQNADIVDELKKLQGSIKKEE